MKMLHQSTPYRNVTVEFGEFGTSVLGDHTASAWPAADDKFPCPCAECTYHREVRDSDSQR